MLLAMLDVLVLACRLLLAGVLVVAAVSKLADREGSRQAVVAFGVPERLAAGVALLLPIAELTVAALLLPASTALAGALGALALLLLFSVAIAVNLARGRAPDCHCFGQLHSAPAGPGTLIRNGALAAVAAFAVAGTLSGSDTSAVAWVGELNGTETTILAAGIVLAVPLAAGGMAFMSLLRAHGRVLVRLEQMEDTFAEAGLGYRTLHRSRSSAWSWARPRRCSPRSTARAPRSRSTICLLPALRCSWSSRARTAARARRCSPTWPSGRPSTRGRLTLAVASEGAPADVRAEVEALGLDHVLVDEKGELYRAFEANGTPSAVLIAPDGSIASRVAAGPDRIEALVADALDAPGVPIGAPVPPLELPSLEGEPVSLADLSGQDTLLLFWNPDCGYCRGMHDDLRAWENTVNGNTPRLVVVSSGDEEATRSDGFRSTVLLDEEFAAGEHFGVSGTPMGVLLDADGRVASGVAAGAAAVLALAEPRGNAEVLTLPEQ